MCGIAGIFSKEDIEPSKEILSNMIQTIRHRGPDAQEVWVDKGIGFAHARLSIIDLNATANQPMRDDASGNVIIFNGEIYNYIELREELSKFGHEFKTASDTEVVLKAYLQWGIDCLNKFNGMWGIAIYDYKNKLLFCSRDRVGIKPFIYGINSRRELIFASEAKAITTQFPEFKAVNEDFLYNFVERDFFACYKNTFYKELFNLLPGHYFLVKAGEIPQQIRYWSWVPKIKSNFEKDESIQNQFKELLIDAIKLRFRSDVPVGSCLSGGIDSGMIVGLASQMFNKPIHTFSCIYPTTPAFDESTYIKASAAKFDTIAKFIEPKHDDFLQMMSSSVYEQDGPTGGASILSQRAVMELASKDVKVLLDGQGADELLGGYHSYFRPSLLTSFRQLLRNKQLIHAWQYWRSASSIKKRFGKKVVRFWELVPLTKNPVSFYTQKIDDSQLHYFKAFENDDLNTLLLEHVFTNLTNLLHYEDRNSMTFSIESRLPYLDYRLVEFAFSLPAHYKIRGSKTKWLLSSIANNVLPHEVLHRKDKMGFTTPAHQWFLQKDNIRYFSNYFEKDNMILTSISPWMQNHLKNSFSLLKNHNDFVPAGSCDFNSLWRFFTANMWLDSL